jgi:uncharacterized protein (TIGR02118 family)
VIKAVGTAYKRDDFTTEEFFRYWMEVHAPISARAPGLRGYVVSEVIRKVQGELETEAFVEQWFDDEEAFLAAGASPEVAAAWDQDRLPVGSPTHEPSSFRRSQCAGYRGWKWIRAQDGREVR